MRKLSEDKKKKLEELETLLNNPTPDLYSNPSKIKSLNFEYNSLKSQEDIISKLNNIETQLQKNTSLLDSETGEMADLLKEEIISLKNEFVSLEEELLELEKPTDPKDFGNCIIEIRAGTGGEEAALHDRDPEGVRGCGAGESEGCRCGPGRHGRRNPLRT